MDEREFAWSEEIFSETMEEEYRRYPRNLDLEREELE